MIAFLCMLISAYFNESLYFINLHAFGIQIVPGIVIAHPGQNITLSCSIALESTNDATVGWTCHIWSECLTQWPSAWVQYIFG